MGFKETHEYINKLRLIVYGLLAVPLMVFVVGYLRTNKGEDIEPLVDDNLVGPLAIFILVADIVMVIYGLYHFKKRVRALRMHQELPEKLKHYYSATVQKFYFFEAALILSLAGLFTTAHAFFVANFVLIIFVFSLENPSIPKMFRHLKIDKEERKRLIEQDREME